MPAGAWPIRRSSPQRYDDSVLGMVLRDRNHPSVTMWGLLNETPDGPVFRHALGFLPELRERDDSRMVMLNSGRLDNLGGHSRRNRRLDRLAQQSGLDGLGRRSGRQASLPGGSAYGRLLQTLRTLGGDGKPLFLSEYGIGSAGGPAAQCPALRTGRQADVDDAQFYRQQRDRFWPTGSGGKCRRSSIARRTSSPRATRGWLPSACLA